LKTAQALPIHFRTVPKGLPGVKRPSLAPVTKKPFFTTDSRPDTRKSLLEKILGKGKGEHTLDPEEAKKAKLEKEEKEESPDFDGDVDTNDVTPVDDDLQVEMSQKISPSASGK
jgi:hypothetical protein